MIIFLDNPKYLPMIQQKFCKELRVMNLSSLYSGYIDITGLLTNMANINITANNLPNFVDSVEFDMMYANALYNDVNLFSIFINIMILFYEGYIVCILVQRDPYRDAIMESIIKLIQQRYGYNCWIIEDEDDLDVIREQQMFPEGIITLDNDIDRANQLQCNGIAQRILPNINIE